MTNLLNPFRNVMIAELMRTPITPLRSTEWAALTGKQRWDVMCALRGPDEENETLKYHTTAVIRAKMRTAIRVGGVINYAQSVILLPTDEVAGGVSSHFLSHVVDATQVLAIPIVWLPLPLPRWPRIDGPDSFVERFTKLIEQESIL